jgi:hypothetical protein|uniref:Uncharacterized protein n=1 Tax=Globisporangium ultimum (strain ATCC 200006 / CBS 805.95 / DAOM BR144) TaxID=431595 RepID=K3WQ65_GLOUD
MTEEYEALKCRYPSKKCWNQRAVKRNGERHNLCEMHRQKANNNQRRLDKKRKGGNMKRSTSPLTMIAVVGDKEARDYDVHDKQHLRIRLTGVYSEQQIQPTLQQQEQQLSPSMDAQHKQMLREREMAAVLVQTRHLQLPPLNAHRAHAPLLPAPLHKISSPLPPSTSSHMFTKAPTILLPPITSVSRATSAEYVARCNATSTSPAPLLVSHPNWSFRYGSEEKIN